MFSDLFSSLNLGLILGIIFAVLLIIGIAGGYKTEKTKKVMVWVSVIGVAAILILAMVPQANVLYQPLTGEKKTLSIGDEGAGAGAGTGTGTGAGTGKTEVTTYQPTATYATQDKFSSTAITGTSYYKSGGVLSTIPFSTHDVVGSTRATTTAITNTQKDKSYGYWVSNSTYWVEPLVFVAGSTTDNVNPNAYANGTGTLTIYDRLGKQSLTNGKNNVSSASLQSLEFDYTGTYHQSAVPFGGMFVAEQNSSIGSVSCTGDIVAGNPSGYKLTYTASSTSNSYQAFELPYGFDDGLGTTRSIICQYNPGTAAGATSPFYGKIIPANYYVALDGNIYLDTEKAADGVSTRVGSNINYPTVTGYWSA